MEIRRYETNYIYSKYLVVLTSMFIVVLLTTTVLANRPIEEYFAGIKLLWPGGMFIFPFSFILLDIVTETFGPKICRVLIIVGFLSEFILSIMSICVSHMSYPAGFKYADSYKNVLDPTFSYAYSSMLGALLSELINSHLLFRWKIILSGQWFVLRSVISTAIGQALLTIVVDWMAFGNRYDFAQLSRMMLSGYFWKMFFVSLMTIPCWAVVKHIKSKGVDYYGEMKVNVNPFVTKIQF